MIRQLLRYFAVPLAMGGLGLVVTLPSWMHAADEGQARLQPSQVPARTVKTYRVMLDGEIVHPNAVNVTTTWYVNSVSSGSEKKTLVPIVDPGATPELPVHVLLEVGEDAPARMRFPIETVIRDAAFERPVTSKIRDEFTRAGIELAPDARIATLYWTNGDKLFAWGITVGMFVVGLFVSEQMRVQRKAAAKN